MRGITKLRVILAVAVLAVLAMPLAVLAQPAALEVMEPASSQGHLATELIPRAGETPAHVSTEVRQNSRLGPEDCNPRQLGPAHTPVRVVTPVPTAGVGTPPPTPQKRWCSIIARKANAGDIYWKADATVTTDTGVEISPGEGFFGLSASNGTCDPYYVVGGTDDLEFWLCEGY